MTRNGDAIPTLLILTALVLVYLSFKSVESVPIIMNYGTPAVSNEFDPTMRSAFLTMAVPANTETPAPTKTRTVVPQPTSTAYISCIASANPNMFSEPCVMPARHDPPTPITPCLFLTPLAGIDRVCARSSDMDGRVVTR